MSDLADDVLKRLQTKQQVDEVGGESPLKETTLIPFKMTAKEVRAICQKNPNHPLAKEKRRSVASLPDSQEVVCDAPDIEAILTDKDVEITTELATRNIMGAEEKVTVVKKRVVARQPIAADTAKPPRPPKE